MPKIPTSKISADRRRIWDNTNTRRKLAYNNDPNYREIQKTAARERWRIVRPPVNIVKNCAGNLPLLASIGKMRPIEGHPHNTLCFNYDEMAELLGGYTSVSLRKWIHSGKFPDAICVDNIPGKTGPPARVYLEHQARGIVAVMSKHQLRKRNLCANDKETIDALMACVP